MHRVLDLDLREHLADHLHGGEAKAVGVGQIDLAGGVKRQHHRHIEFEVAAGLGLKLRKHRLDIGQDFRGQRRFPTGAAGRFGRRGQRSGQGRIVQPAVVLQPGPAVEVHEIVKAGQGVGTGQVLPRRPIDPRQTHPVQFAVTPFGEGLPERILPLRPLDVGIRPAVFVEVVVDRRLAGHFHHREHSRIQVPVALLRDAVDDLALHRRQQNLDQLRIDVGRQQCGDGRVRRGDQGWLRADQGVHRHRHLAAVQLTERTRLGRGIDAFQPRQIVHGAGPCDDALLEQFGDFRIDVHVDYPIAREDILTTSPGAPNERQYHPVSTVEVAAMVVLEAVCEGVT